MDWRIGLLITLHFTTSYAQYRSPYQVTSPKLLDNFNIKVDLNLGFSIKLSRAPGGARIMDLDQYLEKMNTNTNVI